jgi:hypothetical protein
VDLAAEGERAVDGARKRGGAIAIADVAVVAVAEQHARAREAQFDHVIARSAGRTVAQAQPEP